MVIKLELQELQIYIFLKLANNTFINFLFFENNFIYFCYKTLSVLSCSKANESPK
jgi:hypothetical protein